MRQGSEEQRLFWGIGVRPVQPEHSRNRHTRAPRGGEREGSVLQLFWCSGSYAYARARICSAHAT